jgi:CheY-like chemotaxis protein
MPKTLLLADDSVVIQKLVGLSFANEDVDLVTTDNGDDALTRAREVRPDLILADVVMPGRNGYEVCQAIKSDPELRHIPVLLLTGTFEAFDEDRARQVGSDGHITKPFEAQGLVDRVTDLLSKPRPAARPQPPVQAKPAAPAQASPQAPAQTPQAPAQARPQAPVQAKPQLQMKPPTPGTAPVSAHKPLASPVDTRPDSVRPLPPATPAVAAAERRAPSPDDSYDFFDDDVQSAPAPKAPSHTDEAFEFGSDLDGLGQADRGEPETLDTGFEFETGGEGDMTVAVMAEPGPPPVPIDLDAPAAGLAETVIASDDFLPAAGRPSPGARARAAASPAETMLADDLFADSAPGHRAPKPAAAVPPPVPRASARPAPPPLPASITDSGFQFGSAAPTQSPAPLDADFLNEDAAPSAREPEAVADLDFDMVDSADPLDGISEPSLEPWGSDDGDFESAGDAPGLADAAESTHSGFDVSVSDLGDPLGSSSPLVAELMPPTRATVSDAKMGHDLSPVMREQIHEVLEKVAWEAFADVSDSIVRQVLQRVESVVWEVVPQMAEALIQEEIRRMKGDD